MKTTLGFLTEEGRTRRKNAARRICVYATLMFLIGCASSYAIHRYWVSPSLTPLQRVYFKQYLKSTYRSYLPNAKSRYTTLSAILIDPKGKEQKSAAIDLMVEPLLDENGRIKFDARHYPFFQTREGVQAKKLFWEEKIAVDKEAYDWLQTTIYDDQSIPDIWRPAWLGAVLIFVFGTIGLTAIDMFAQRQYLKGQPVRGTRELSPKAYSREHRGHVGYQFTVYATVVSALRKLLDIKSSSYILSVPYAEENEGLLLLGDPGTGKSQAIHQLFDRISERDPTEAVIIYDPAGEFIERHFNPATDIVVNPLDARCPYWAPHLEITEGDEKLTTAERQFIAESFFPCPDDASQTARFFIMAARAIFAWMLLCNPSPEQIVEMLCDEELIDQCVAGTEHAHLISRGAKGQRGGVLATLSEVGETFKLLPSAEECKKRGLFLKKWAKRRRGRLFITSSHTTREPLRRFDAALLNILLGCLLGESYALSGERSCWVIIDEVHALKHLPILKSALVEARKYGVKFVLGTQNKTQFEEHYGRGAATMLASSHTKMLYRCNEPESARWVSEMVGEEEKERPRVSTTATVQANGRDSINYSTLTERRVVVSKEQIMALPNLHGYWKYADSVVPFRIEPIDRPQVAPSFVPRPRKSIVQKELKPQPLALVASAESASANGNGDGNGNGKHTAEITSEVIEGLDVGF